LFGGSAFLAEYPYFLPCAVHAAMLIVVCGISWLWLAETHKRPEGFLSWLGVKKPSRRNKTNGASNTSGSGEEENPEDPPLDPSEQPYPLLKLLKYPYIAMVIMNYALLSLSQSSLNIFQPLFLSVSVPSGGLGLHPSTIGKIIAVFGFLNGALQLLFFEKLFKRFGGRGFTMAGIVCGVPMIASFWGANWLKRNGFADEWVWAVLGVQTLSKVGVNMSYSKAF
jgi:hypothetical protein